MRPYRGGSAKHETELAIHPELMKLVLELWKDVHKNHVRKSPDALKNLFLHVGNQREWENSRALAACATVATPMIVALVERRANVRLGVLTESVTSQYRRSFLCTPHFLRCRTRIRGARAARVAGIREARISRRTKFRSTSCRTRSSQIPSPARSTQALDRATRKQQGRPFCGVFPRQPPRDQAHHPHISHQRVLQNNTT